MWPTSAPTTRALRAVAVLSASCLVSCGGSGDPPLAINDNGNGVTAGEYLREPGDLVTFGVGTVENVGTEPITLVGVRAEMFGDIELVDGLVSGADRESVWIASDDDFPPDNSDLGTTSPIEGHVLPPEPGRPGFPSDNLLLGFRVGGSTTEAGMISYCVDYRVGEDDDVESRCWSDQHLRVCADLDSPACVIPGEE